MFDSPALAPKNELAPAVFTSPALSPKNEFRLPVLFLPASLPKKELLLAPELPKPAENPKYEFELPLVVVGPRSALFAPLAAHFFVYQRQIRRRSLTELADSYRCLVRRVLNDR